MPLPLLPPTVNDLTEADLAGNGVFDVLMRSVKAHLDEEFSRNRIKGSEYSTVYLGALTAVLDQGMQFLLTKDKQALDAQLVQAQIALVQQQTLNAKQEGANLVTAGEIALVQKQLLQQQVLNAATENEVMLKQICKLQAEFDLIMNQKLKTASETALLDQKKVTEQAQVVAVGVDENSIIGKQKKLYEAQTNGFSRDAEQKAAKLMVDSWNVRRTTDEGTVADGVNMLNDAAIGRAVTKLLQGIGA